MNRVRRLLTVLLLGLVVSMGWAQSRQTGTIELLQQDAGYMDISGQRYSVEQGRTRVFVEDRELRLHDMDQGMVVAFTTDGDGTLLRIEILGPADRIRELDRN